MSKRSRRTCVRVCMRASVSLYVENVEGCRRIRTHENTHDTSHTEGDLSKICAKLHFEFCARLNDFSSFWGDGASQLETVNTYIGACKHTCRHMQTHTDTHTHTQTDRQTDTHTHIHTYIHTHTYAYTYTHTHTHTLGVYA